MVTKPLILRYSYVLQEMGLEPTRYCYHRHLKPARLPIPPLLRAKHILSFFCGNVNGIWEILSMQIYSLFIE